MNTRENFNSLGMMQPDFSYTGCVVVGYGTKTGAQVTLWAGEYSDQGDPMGRARELVESAGVASLDGETFLPKYFHFFNKDGQSRYIFK